MKTHTGETKSTKVSLRLTNTLTNRVEPFIPINENHVSIYCCGVTVYDLCHLGHARSYIIWDVLRRYLIWSGYKVTFVQNFTDIDDKIIKRAAEEKSSMKEVSEKNILEFHHDMDSLGILRPDRMPKATNYLAMIRNLIEELEQKGAAYSIDGDVYFSVKKFERYGKLSGRDINQQQKNADGRIGTDEEARKQNPFDFALWKGAKQGEPCFPSRWGEGRPGWHIECSAMVKAELGETIDIHLGGADLIFPHHENEIAQSESATGKQLARYWLHNGMVNVSGQKMSKSLGNFTTIRDLLEQGISPMTLRLFILQAHYRKPLDFTNEAINSTSSGWNNLNKALLLGKKYSKELNWNSQKDIGNELLLEQRKDYSENPLERIRKEFIDSLNDDLNTSKAIAILFDLARPLRVVSNRIEREGQDIINQKVNEDLLQKWNLLIELSGVLGLSPEEEANNKQKKQLTKESIEALIASRIKAKKARDFKNADRIRSELRLFGIELIDKPGGKTDWVQN